MISAKGKFIAVAMLSFALVGCGGGGSSSPAAPIVATTPAGTLSQQDPAALVKSAVDTGISSAQMSSATGSFTTAASEITVKSVAEKAVQSFDCATNLQLRDTCAGQLSVDTSLVAGTRGGIPAGSYLNMSFTGFRALSAPPDQALSGTIAMTFVDAFTSSTLFNGTAKIKLDTTSPQPEVHTNLALTFRQLSVFGSGNDVTLTGAASVLEVGQPAVEVSFTAWRTLGSRPQPGSRATISSSGDSVSIQVISLAGVQTTFDVTLTSAGVVKPTKRVTQDIVNGVANYKTL
jgi:hypothetical protein